MIYLIGTGPMARAHAKVLLHLGKEFIVIGRGLESAKAFNAEIGVRPIIGGIESYLLNSKLKDSDYVVIATGTESLMQILKIVLIAGAGKILIEKPAAISIQELLENESFLKSYADKVFVAYNRRFYASVLEAIKLIDEDGGLESMHFEFTEWVHKIDQLDKAPGVKENWFFANSTHLVDLAFFIAGKPKDWKAYSKSGRVQWHAKTKFVGSGITEKGVLFSYHSNWESAGRWGIELMTYKRKIILRPLEEVQILWKGTINIEKHAIDHNLDYTFKPGLIRQMSSFLQKADLNIINIGEHMSNSINIYNLILNAR